jgi:hypothetical protein
MATTNFTDFSTTIVASWLNDVDAITYDVFNGATTAALARTALGLVIGTNVQAYSATLQSLSSIGTAAGKYAFTNGIASWQEGTITAAGRALLDDADAAAQLATLGVTSTAAELNKLAGTPAGLTSIELGYVDGVTSAIQTQLNLKAALASPTFTGTPTLPTGTIATTQTAGNNTTAVATTAFVTTAAAAVGTVIATPQASTSGTTITFSSIPSTAKQIVISFVGVSVSGTSPIVVELGDSGGLEATGYTWQGISFRGSTVAVTTQSLSTGFGISDQTNENATDAFTGKMVLNLESSATNTWTCTGTFYNGRSTTNIGTTTFVGSKATSAALDRIGITTIGGANTFDAGEINIMYS